MISRKESPRLSIPMDESDSELRSKPEPVVGRTVGVCFPVSSAFFVFVFFAFFLGGAQVEDDDGGGEAART